MANCLSIARAPMESYPAVEGSTSWKLQSIDNDAPWSLKSPPGRVRPKKRLWTAVESALSTRRCTGRFASPSRLSHLITPGASKLDNLSTPPIQCRHDYQNAR